MAEEKHRFPPICSNSLKIVNCDDNKVGEFELHIHGFGNKYKIDLYGVNANYTQHINKVFLC